MLPPHLGSPWPSSEHSQEGEKAAMSLQRRFDSDSISTAQELHGRPAALCRMGIVNHPAAWGCWGNLWPKGAGAPATAGLAPRPGPAFLRGSQLQLPVRQAQLRPRSSGQALYEGRADSWA